MGRKKSRAAVPDGQKPDAKADGFAKRAANGYAQVVVDGLIKQGLQQKDLAAKTGLVPAAISDIKRAKNTFDIGTLERIARGLCDMSFGEFQIAAEQWFAEQSRSPVVLDPRRANRHTAERAAVALGLATDKVRVWADSVYAGLETQEDPPADWVVARILLERARNPEARMTATRPDKWLGWTEIRNALLRDADKSDLHAYVIGFGETPTTTPRPDPLDLRAVLPHLEAFAKAHPPLDPAWNDIVGDWDRTAGELRRKLTPEHDATEPPASQDATSATIKIVREDKDR